MMRATSGELREEILLVCIECGREIDLCAFCDETGCGSALCYRSVNRLLGQAVPDPHPFDGDARSFLLRRR
jgi:hypothetical protein